ncbi:MAG: hypothetical protein A2010_06405 [Nitrospirae bacterium GWD2_57_9]|nr:MAG: hypothetical protein A2010_06405 [Nitrospirae bacterium GWD2_57_9]
MRTRKQFVFIVVVLAVMGFTAITPVPANAATLDPVTFSQDLYSLVLQGNDLLASMSRITLTSLALSTQLVQLESSVSDYLLKVGTVYKAVAAAVDTTTFSITNDMLISLQALSSISASLSSGLLSFSQTITTLAPITALSTLQASMEAMLALSADIGTMADRILEMADNILLMADNIGLMADRILATQVIQSDNVKVVTDAMLQSQKNTILLIAVFKL